MFKELTIHPKNISVEYANTQRELILACMYL